MFSAYVICQKRSGGTAVISKQEFQSYSKERRRREFTFVAWLTSPADEFVLSHRWPRLRRLIDLAHRLGLGGSDVQ